jgi:hypothetical protein
LKKQSQFLKGQNWRKVNYKKEIREIHCIGHMVKNKANQTQSQLAPRPVLGIENEVEKTKPI